VEEQTGVLTDFTPACSNYLKHSKEDHLGRPQTTKEYLWIDVVRQKPFLFSEKEIF